MAVAQGVDADTRRKIEIFLAVGVPGGHALALCQHDLAAAVGVEDVVVVPGNHFFGIHLGYPLYHVQEPSPIRGSLFNQRFPRR